MFRRFFQFAGETDLPRHGADSSRGGGSAVAIEDEEAMTQSLSVSPSNLSPEESLARAKTTSFEQIYQGAAVKPPRLPYGILKVSSMVHSTHLEGMTPEAKRCALLMALEAAGAEIEDLLQDAVVRHRALSDYEDMLQERLQKFETAKTEENRLIQAELDRLTKQYMSRIQANLDQVAREQDDFREWQQRKQRESEMITEAATFCVPQDSVNTNAGLTAVLERANYRRR